MTNHIALPWQRSTYSGRFLRAVCITSKLPLPIQYMNVGRKSVARLQLRKQVYGDGYTAFSPDYDKSSYSPVNFQACLREILYYVTWDCSEYSAKQDWRPCFDTTPRMTPLVSADRSVKNYTDIITHKHYTWFSFFFSWCLWLTIKYWMISGLLLDLSSTSVNTSNTSRANKMR